MNENRGFGWTDPIMLIAGLLAMMVSVLYFILRFPLINLRTIDYIVTISGLIAGSVIIIKYIKELVNEPKNIFSQ
jgi:hypothetical protein